MPGQFHAAESAVALRLPAQSKTPLVFPAVIFLLGVVLKLSAENRIFRFLVDEQDAHLTALNKTALLLTARFGLLARVRFACLATGAIPLLAAPVSGLTGATQFTLLVSAVLLCLSGELIERHLFFVAEVAPKMPGGGTT
jgi:DMSO reductase anchor subunit